MSAQPQLPSDIEGLARQVDPLSRRGFFMSSAAAAAAGYTLAAGPVRAQVVTTDTAGLTVGEAKVKVAGGEMPVYFARPANVQNPPVILVAMEIFGLHEYIKDVTRRLGKLGAFAVAPDYYFRKGEDLTKITEIPKLMPIVNSKPDAELIADLDATVAWAKSQGGNTDKLGIMGYCRGGRTVWVYSAHNPNAEGRRRVLRLAGRSGRPEGDLAEEPDPARARHEGAGARPLRRGGCRHSARAGRRHEGGARGGEQDRPRSSSIRRAARLPCRLPAELSQGSRRRCLGADDGVVQETRRAELSRSDARAARARDPS